MTHAPHHDYRRCVDSRCPACDDSKPEPCAQCGDDTHEWSGWRGDDGRLYCGMECEDDALKMAEVGL